MHLGRFHRAIELLHADYQAIKHDKLLQDIVGHLNAMSGNPGNAEIATNFKKSIDTCRSTLLQSALNRPRPILRLMLESIGANEFIGERFFLRVMAAIEANPGATALVVQSITALQQDTQKFYQQIATLDKTFSGLKVEYDELEEGEAEIGLLIPRNDQASSLKDLSKIFNHWHNALTPIKEVFDPQAGSLQIRLCSTTDWMFYLISTPLVLAGLSYCMKKINEILGEAVKMRELVAQLVHAKAPQKAIDLIEKDGDGKLDKELRTLAKDVLRQHYKENDEGRKNELENHLTISFKRIAHEITNGTKVEVRLIPPRQEESQDEEAEPREPDAHIAELEKLAATLDDEVELLSFSGDANALQGLLPPPAPDETLNT